MFVNLCYACRQRPVALPATIDGFIERRPEICVLCQNKVDKAIREFLQAKFGRVNIQRVTVRKNIL